MNSIELHNISVRFRLYHEKVFTLKEKVINILKRKNTYEDFYALKGLRLTVEKGETLGIIGENGAGKSTLLKLICRVLRPDSGIVTVNGSISALLELGAGFDQDLTGRENIFLNGSLMGFSKKEMQKKFNHILEFSELENFIDLPIKNYSSGMYMRLGFAIAIDVDPDILIIDEILAVGDASFQKKCINKIKDFKSQGKTIILVSHSHDMIKNFCNKALWIRNGEKVLCDTSERVVYEYLRYLQQKERQKFEEKLGKPHEMVTAKEAAPVEEAPEEAPGIQEPEPKKAEPEESEPEESEPEICNRWGSYELTIDSVEFYGHDDKKKNVFNVGEDFCVKLKYSAKEPLDNPAFAIQIFREDGRYVHGTNTMQRGVETGEISGSGEIMIKYKNISLGGGIYLVRACATRKGDKNWINPYDFQNMTHKFMVQDQADKQQGQIGESYLQHEWIKR